MVEINKKADKLLILLFILCYNYYFRIVQKIKETNNTAPIISPLLINRLFLLTDIDIIIISQSTPKERKRVFNLYSYDSPYWGTIINNNKIVCIIRNNFSEKSKLIIKLLIYVLYTIIDLQQHNQPNLPTHHQYNHYIANLQ